MIQEGSIKITGSLADNRNILVAIDALFTKRRLNYLYIVMSSNHFDQAGFPSLGFGESVYWVYPAQNLSVQYSYCMANGQCSPTASATFNVSGPTNVTMISTSYGTLSIDDWTSDATCIQPATLYLVSGNVNWTVVSGTCVSSGSYGYTATPSGATAGGTLLYIQLVNNGSLSDRLSCTISPGLDSGVPYPYVKPATNMVCDFPAIALKSTYTSQTRMDDLSTYLMWQSNTTGLIMVPVSYQESTFSGSASCSNSCGSARNWTLGSGNGGTD